ncbi:MAG TPA: gamma-glutamyltransferase [Chitinophagaceae bacterium]|nr:gamma-glutamyltransferase [Chitinophagaceae bacterium]
MKNVALSILLFILATSVYAQSTMVVGPGREVDPYHYQSIKSAAYSKACVASAHPIASQVGIAIMKRGGNAYDAMIATQLALAVVYPAAGNIGGGGFLTGRLSNGKLITIDYREMASGQATKNMYLDKNGNPEMNLSQNGSLSSGVPGTVAGLFATHKYAKLPFKELIQPAIDLAENGFVISASQARDFNSLKNVFLKYNTKPTAFVKATPWKEGDTLFQPELAATLKRIRDNGARGFYEGETAKLVVDEMRRSGGIISYDDLKNYTAKERSPITFNYRGYEIVSFPPPSSGGLLIAQMLKMIEKFPVGSYGFESTRSTQLMIEAERRAYADRAEHMGDPDYWKVPVKTLISDEYLAERMKDYDSTHASKSTDIQAGIIHESDQTTHISIIDADGNMVAVTTTLNNSYGSKTVAGGAGFLLNDEMDDFSVKPGVPNLYGATGGAANAISPGKRMLSSMTPTLVLKDNKPFMVVGTPGGTTIPTSVFQSIVDVIDFGMNADDAVNKPKFHHQWLPDEVILEKGFPEETKTTLEKMGYTIKERGAIGRTELIKILPDGMREAAADKRGDDSVAGY